MVDCISHWMHVKADQTLHYSKNKKHILINYFKVEKVEKFIILSTSDCSLFLIHSSP